MSDVRSYAIYEMSSSYSLQAREFLQLYLRHFGVAEEVYFFLSTE
jgi:hypothetical protein